MAGSGIARPFPWGMSAPRPPAPPAAAPVSAAPPNYSAMRSAARSENGQDDASATDSFTGLLGALDSRGYLAGSGGSHASASSGGMGAGVWTPEMPSAGMVSGPHVQHVDTTAARTAAFNTAKDQVGQTASGALTALRSALAGRGMLGSGREARGTAGVINAGQAQLGEVTRANAIKDADVAEREAQTNYQGDITQRGQDLAAIAERNSQRLTARGQDFGREASSSSGDAARLQAVLGLYNAFRRARY